MSHHPVENNVRPPYDEVMDAIATYVLEYKINSPLAYDTARLCLMDSLGCAMLSLSFPECRKVLGPVVPGAILPGGARVPGTDYELDPIQAAFNIGTMIRWLDFNDTWLAAEWGHPSDNLGAILAVADYLSRERLKNNKPSLTMQDVLTMMIKAHEIQGCLALENSFNRVGLDHVVLVKLASAAVVSAALGGDKNAVIHTLSQVFVDGQSLRTYRHSPNTGSRKSWAAGDATARAVRLALLVQAGEMGYPSALTAKTWGFYDVLFKGKPFTFQRPYGSYVMENVLFKISYPAEFHAQTAVECAARLHTSIKNRLSDIKRIEIHTQEPAIRIISKSGPLYNPADRDHCIQYMVAVGLIYGDLHVTHYEDKIAALPEIDNLRDKMQVFEDKQFSKDYLNPHKRSIANRIQVFFQDGTATEAITIEYPLGHRNRREEGIPMLLKKCHNNLLSVYTQQEALKRLDSVEDLEVLFKQSVVDFMELWAKAPHA